MLRLSQYSGEIAQGVQLDQKPAGTAGYVLVPIYEDVTDIQNQVAAASYAVSHTIYVADNAPGLEQWVVAGVSVRFSTASTSGTLQVEVAPTGTAIAAGVNQLTGTISLAGSANTTVNGTVIAAPTVIVPGSAINLIFAGTVTNLLGMVTTIALQRVS